VREPRAADLAGVTKDLIDVVLPAEVEGGGAHRALGLGVREAEVLPVPALVTHHNHVEGDTLQRRGREVVIAGEFDPEPLLPDAAAAGPADAAQLRAVPFQDVAQLVDRLAVYATAVCTCMNRLNGL
jgi:hypothetical protein